MHMKWKLFRLNALFWIIAFAMKVPFDYYIICLPSVEPVGAGQLALQRSSFPSRVCSTDTYLL
mgnify:CR=1 FL=1